MSRTMSLGAGELDEFESGQTDGAGADNEA